MTSGLFPKRVVVLAVTDKKNITRLWLDRVSFRWVKETTCTVNTFTTSHTKYFILNLVIPKKGLDSDIIQCHLPYMACCGQIAPTSEIKVMNNTPTSPHDRQISLQKLIKSSELLYKKLPFFPAWAWTIIFTFITSTSRRFCSKTTPPSQKYKRWFS